MHETEFEISIARDNGGHCAAWFCVGACYYGMKQLAGYYGLSKDKTPQQYQAFRDGALEYFDKFNMHIDASGTITRKFRKTM